jgi:hypothetical protein
MTAREKDADTLVPWDKATSETCFYPNCGFRHAIEQGDAHVVWDAHLPLQTIYAMFPPVVKLAIQENTNHRKEYPNRMLTVYFHPECAAEWGMQLIQDALKANYRVGRRLSNREKDWNYHDEE